MADQTQHDPVHREGIEAHYTALFGAPETRNMYKTKTHSFEVLSWTPQQTGEDVYLFATLGAFAVMGTRAHRCEFFFGLTEAPAGLADSLAEVALDGNGTRDIPSAGDTVTLAFPLWEGTQARSYLFTDGGDEIIPALQAEGSTVEFIQLVPLFADELAYKKAHGEPALWQHFEENEVAYWDPTRGASL